MTFKRYCQSETTEINTIDAPLVLNGATVKTIQKKSGKGKSWLQIIVPKSELDLLQQSSHSGSEQWIKVYGSFSEDSESTEPKTHLKALSFPARSLSLRGMVKSEHDSDDMLYEAQVPMERVKVSDAITESDDNEAPEDFIRKELACRAAERANQPQLMISSRSNTSLTTHDASSYIPQDMMAWIVVGSAGLFLTLKQYTGGDTVPSFLHSLITGTGSSYLYFSRNTSYVERITLQREPANTWKSFCH